MLTSDVAVLAACWRFFEHTVAADAVHIVGDAAVHAEGAWGAVAVHDADAVVRTVAADAVNAAVNAAVQIGGAFDGPADVGSRIEVHGVHGALRWGCCLRRWLR